MLIFTKPSHSKWKVLHFAQKPRIFLFCVNLIFVQFHKCLGGQIPFSFSLSCSIHCEAVFFTSHNPLVSSPFLSAREPRVGKIRHRAVQIYSIRYEAVFFTPNSALRLPLVACMATTSQSFFTSFELLGCSLIQIPHSEFLTATPYGRGHGFPLFLLFTIFK